MLQNYDIMAIQKWEFRWTYDQDIIIIKTSMSEKRPRISRESRTVAVMIAGYCRAHHEGRELCSECAALRDYALERLHKCLFGEGKTTCAKCPVHCYRPEMREKIRVVMRYSGPRMLFRHPVMTVRYLIDKRRKEPVMPHNKSDS